MISNNRTARFSYAECKSLSELSECSLPEIIFTDSDYEIIREKFGIIGMDIQILGFDSKCRLDFVCLSSKGPYTRNSRLWDPKAEPCFGDCWYFEYHIDIVFDQKRKSWLSASGDPIPGMENCPP